MGNGRSYEKTVTTVLSEPSSSLVAMLLQEVAYDDRLEGCLMREHSGAVPVAVYSLEEAVRFLSDTFPLVNVSDLVSWIRKAIGDKELSEKIEEAVKGESCTMSGIRIAAGLMAQRLGQIHQRRVRL